MFIRNEDKEKINLDDYKDPYVESLNGNKWHICVDYKDQNQMRIIAIFDSVEKANTALISLMQAKENSYNIGWDAIEYKDKLMNPLPTVVVP